MGGPLASSGQFELKGRIQGAFEDACGIAEELGEREEMSWHRYAVRDARRIVLRKS